MILKKKFTAKEVLEALAHLIAQDIPGHVKGTIEISYDDDDGVEITFTEEPKDLS